MLQGFFQIVLTLLILVAITPFLGGYIARVFLGEKTLLDPVMGPAERVIYTLGGVRATENMTGWQYARAVLYSNIAMGILIFLIIANQGWLPLNPTDLGAPTWAQRCTPPSPSSPIQTSSTTPARQL
jgi:K+-transporting ATPase ATPase A chain